MKVVHLSIEDSFGAGRAAIRISKAVAKVGADSAVYVLKKNESVDSYAIRLKRADRLKVAMYDRINHILLNKYPEHGYFHVDKYGIDISKYAEIRGADILHFHWINEGIWSKKFIQSLIELKKPIVWTMHDMWPFTGGCHYDNFCGKYKEECSKCKTLCSTKTNDCAKKAQKNKMQYLENLNIQLVGCSRWITEQANESSIGRGMRRKAINIPNPTEDKIFKMYDKSICKQLLGVKESKMLILFGAVNVASDKRKGAKYLLEALKMLDPEKYVLGVFGSKSIDLGMEDFEVINLGRVSDDFHLSIIYNAADVFVAPSIQENLANTVMESLTCGTPVVAFDIGGMGDMIIDKENGYLVKPFEVDELTDKIEAAVELSTKRKEIRQNMLERFSGEFVGVAYLEIYKDILCNVDGVGNEKCIY